jgi:hypothetical protein
VPTQDLGFSTAPGHLRCSDNARMLVHGYTIFLSINTVATLRNPVPRCVDQAWTAHMQSSRPLRLRCMALEYATTPNTLR